MRSSNRLPTRVLYSKLFTTVRPLGRVGILRCRAFVGVIITVCRVVVAATVVVTTVDNTVIVVILAGGGVCVGTDITHATSKPRKIAKNVNRQIVLIVTHQ